MIFFKKNLMPLGSDSINGALEQVHFWSFPRESHLKCFCSMSHKLFSEIFPTQKEAAGGFSGILHILGLHPHGSLFLAT